MCDEIKKLNAEYRIVTDELQQKYADKLISEKQYYKYLEQINSSYNLDLQDIAMFIGSN